MLWCVAQDFVPCDMHWNRRWYVLSMHHDKRHPHHPHHHLTEHQTNFFSPLIIKTTPPSSPPCNTNQDKCMRLISKFFVRVEIYIFIHWFVHFSSPPTWRDHRTWWKWGGNDGTEPWMWRNRTCHAGTEPYMLRNGWWHAGSGAYMSRNGSWHVGTESCVVRNGH